MGRRHRRAGAGAEAGARGAWAGGARAEGGGGGAGGEPGEEGGPQVPPGSQASMEDQVRDPAVRIPSPLPPTSLHPAGAEAAPVASEGLGGGDDVPSSGRG